MSESVSFHIYNKKGWSIDKDEPMLIYNFTDRRVVTIEGEMLYSSSNLYHYCSFDIHEDLGFEYQYEAVPSSEYLALFPQVEAHAEWSYGNQRIFGRVRGNKPANPFYINMNRQWARMKGATLTTPVIYNIVNHLPVESYSLDDYDRPTWVSCTIDLSKCVDTFNGYSARIDGTIGGPSFAIDGVVPSTVFTPVAVEMNKSISIEYTGKCTFNTWDGYQKYNSRLNLIYHPGFGRFYAGLSHNSNIVPAIPPSGNISIGGNTGEQNS